MEVSHARVPKQQRSRESYDRIIAAAIDLLNRGGLAALTLAAVSRESKVSIGSIYCRVDGKESLVRDVQSVVLQQMEREFTKLTRRVRVKQLPLAQLVPVLVATLATYLRRHSALLAAFMQQGDHDPVVENLGRRSFQNTLRDFKLLLLDRAEEIAHPEPDAAAIACFTVIYATLGRFLGLNAGARGHGGAGEGNWKRLVNDLSAMCLAFLKVDPHQSSETRRRGR